VLRFQLSHERGGSALADFTQDSLRVFRINGNRWEEFKATLLPHPIDIVTVETRQLGVFALAGKPSLKPYQQSPTSIDIFEMSPKDGFEDLQALLLFR
jgi:hypothetical protein